VSNRRVSKSFVFVLVAVQLVTEGVEEAVACLMSASDFF
jgi:hypothetical protein